MEFDVGITIGHLHSTRTRTRDALIDQQTGTCRVCERHVREEQLMRGEAARVGRFDGGTQTKERHLETERCAAGVLE